MLGMSECAACDVDLNVLELLVGVLEQHWEEVGLWESRLTSSVLGYLVPGASVWFPLCVSWPP